MLTAQTLPGPAKSGILDLTADPCTENPFRWREPIPSDTTRTISALTWAELVLQDTAGTEETQAFQKTSQAGIGGKSCGP